MREIKFRAWCGGLNKYADSCEVYFDGSWGYSIKHETHVEEAMPDESDVIEQYTGLKDSNDKEIYEGDILEDGKGSSGVVKWVHSLACFAVWADNKLWSLNEGDENRKTKLEYTKIIGNVCESYESEQEY